jgi:hypothetical protein
MPCWTEAEAKTKWCPFARSAAAVAMPNASGIITSYSAGLVAHNRDNPNGHIPACIASHCMAWRWIGKKKLRDIDLVSSDVVEEPPRLGYCGLSGKPEMEF